MKFHPLCCVALAGILAGCAEDRPAIVYRQPLTSPGGEFATLPPTVQNSVRAQAGAAEIDQVSKDTSGGAPVYEFHFRNAEMFQPLYVAADGSVLTSNREVAVGASADTIEAATGSA